jgi:Family of unknown function (DUF6325)
MVEEARGSVELAAIAFPGSKFNGEIIPALADLVDSGVVAILDLLIISKSEEGDVLSLEVGEMEDGGMFDDLDGDVMGLLSAADIETAGQLLEPGNTAALIVWEHLGPQAHRGDPGRRWRVAGPRQTGCRDRERGHGDE